MDSDDPAGPRLSCPRPLVGEHDGFAQYLIDQREGLFVFTILHEYANDCYSSARRGNDDFFIPLLLIPALAIHDNQIKRWRLCCLVVDEQDIIGVRSVKRN